MIASRVNPINVSPTKTTTADAFLSHVVQSITMGVRVGEDVDVNMGYIQNFTWNIDRPSSEVYQIEPVVNGTFGSALATLAKTDGSDTFVGSKYFPGEVIEIIPGKQGAASLDIKRCVLYGSNIFSALMGIENAGTEGIDGVTEDPSKVVGGNLLNYVTLIQQVRPIYIKQVFYNPIDGSIAWGREFQDVWIEKWTEEIPGADKNEAVIDSITAKATRIRPIAGTSSGSASGAGSQ